MTTQHIEIKKEKILFVEGRDEENFFNKLFNSLGIKDVQAMEVGGKDNFKNKFSDLLKHQKQKFLSVNKIAFVRDADECRENAFKSIIDTLVTAICKNYPKDEEIEFQSIREIIKETIEKLDKNSTCCIFDIESIKSIKDNTKMTKNFRTGIYIMPDNKSPGTLEDLCLKYMEKDQIADCVNKYIDCIKERGINFNKESKSKIHSYLSVKQNDKEEIVDPPSIGIAAQKNIFDFNDDCFKNIKDFLEKMYEYP